MKNIYLPFGPLGYDFSLPSNYNSQMIQEYKAVKSMIQEYI